MRGASLGMRAAFAALLVAMMAASALVWGVAALALTLAGLALWSELTEAGAWIRGAAAELHVAAALSLALFAAATARFSWRALSNGNVRGACTLMLLALACAWSAARWPAYGGALEDVVRAAIQPFLAGSS